MKKSIALLSVLVFALQILPLIPGGAAVTTPTAWVTKSGCTPLGTTTPSVDVDLAQLNLTGNLILVYGDASQKVRGTRVVQNDFTDSGTSGMSQATCNHDQFLSTTTAINQQSLFSRPGQDYVYDVYSGSALRVAAGDGISWGDQSISGSMATEGGIFAAANGTLIVFGRDPGTTTGRSASSLDGITWVRNTQTAGAFAPKDAAKKDSSTYLVVGEDGAGNEVSYRTTNFGVSWTQTTPSTISTSSEVGRPSLSYASGSIWIGAGISAAQKIRFFKSVNDGVTWTTNEFGSAYTSLSILDTLAISGSEYAILAAENGGAGNRKLSMFHTIDSGATWDESIIHAGTPTSLYNNANARGRLLYQGDSWYAAYYRKECASGCGVVGTTTYAFIAKTVIDTTVTASASTDAFPAGSLLKAFDVDSSGDRLIARLVDTVPNPDTNALKLYSGGGLGTALDTDLESCRFNDGVMAQGFAVAYTTCTINGGPPSHASTLLIRGPSDLQGFNQQIANPDCDACPDSVTLDATGPNEVGEEPNQELSQVAFYPIDQRHIAGDHNFHNFGTTGGGFFGICPHPDPCSSLRMAWAQSTTHGYLGLTSFTYREDGTDDRQDVYRPFGSLAGGAPEEICTVLRPQDGLNGNTFTMIVGAVDTTANTLTVEAKFTETSNFGRGDTFNADQAGLVPSFNGPNTGHGWSSSTLGQAKGIACSPTLTIVSQDDKVWMVNTTTGATIHAVIPVENTAAPRPAAVSANGQYFAYYDNSFVRVANATGVVKCSFPVQQGTFVGVRLHGTAQSIWIGTTESIRRYSLTDPTTCPVPVPVDINPGQPPVATSSSDTSFLGLIAAGGAGAGLPDVAWKAFVGFIFVGGAAILFAGALAPFAGAHGAAIGAMVGGVVGFGISWKFGFFDAGLVFLVVVVLGSLVVLRFAGRS